MKYEAIEDFLARARKLNKSNKDMRLSYDEAMGLAVSLAELLARLNKQQSTEVAVISAPKVIDGGTFPKRS